MSDYLDRIKKIMELKSRAEALEVMEEALKRGFKYVVRDCDSEYLSFFSLKPKKYTDLGSWGYVNENAQGALPSIVVLRNTDITEISWRNKHPIIITEFLKYQKAGLEDELFRVEEVK
ncbi:DNA topoisomerase [Enterococcus faecalis]|uniref:DNA topoisomerase n=1 Tax=Enterococcus faecalis TaxID=1351 RepID=UPI000CF73824|nr:DNA topoisomerase [Enterococcus faecalis]PQC15940.1 DNA topoisomerase [Enterococcus faecalis]